MTAEQRSRAVEVMARAVYSIGHSEAPDWPEDPVMRGVWIKFSDTALAALLKIADVTMKEEG